MKNGLIAKAHASNLIDTPMIAGVYRESGDAVTLCPGGGWCAPLKWLMIAAF